MKVIKPLRLGLLTRVFEHRRLSRLSVSVMAFRRFDTPRALLTDAALWKFVAEELGEEAILDECMPKSQAEWLVWGAAHAPQPVIARAITATFGVQSKTLRVTGDRYWRPDLDGVATAPEPFTSLPLRWSRAFGGAGHAANPYGKGMAPVKVGTASLIPLPNVEASSSFVRSSRDRPHPVGLAPMDVTFAARAALVGTYDDVWLREHFPGLAEDIDWRFFNVAPVDQRAPEFFHGDEVFSFEGMHPTQPTVSGALAPLLARCFLHQRDPDGAETFREVPTRLETVWLFPHAGFSVCIWRGVAAVTEYDAHDVLRLVVGADDPEAPRPVEHYERVMWQRLDKKDGAVASLRERDLVPDWPGADGPPDDDGVKAATTASGVMGENARRGAAREAAQRRAMLVGLGLDPEEHGPLAVPPAPTLPTFEELPEAAHRAEVEGRRLEALERAAAQQREERIRQTFREHGMDFGEIEEERATVPAGPPTFTAQGKMDALRVIAEKSRAEGVVVDEIEEMLRDESLWRRWREAEQRMREAYRVSAHQSPSAPRMSVEDSERARAMVFTAMAEKKSLDGVDLTGADLSGIDLAGGSLRGAFLEGVMFQRCDLAGVDFTDAVLTRADLTGARLEGSKLQGANLGRASLRRAWCLGADFTRAILAGAHLEGAVLREAVLTEADTLDASLRGADLEGLRAERMILMKVDLDGVNLRGASLPQAVFLECSLEGAQLVGAKLTGATFQAVRAAGLRAEGADLTNLRCIDRCDLTGADFRRAQMAGVQLRGARLEGADFSEARLDRADFSEADARGARFYHAHAWEARWVRSNLSAAVLLGADLLGGIFHAADLRGADLRGANLWTADLARVYSDASTQLTEANLGKVNIRPRRQV